MNKKQKREKKEIIIAENRAFEGIWIPRRLYITNKFNPRTKFFIVELKSLSKKGYCFATDRHFADFLGVSTRVVQTMIKSLKDDGYLETEYEYEKDTRAIKRRFLILTKKFLDEFYNEKEPERNEEKFDTPYEENFNEPYEENFNRGSEQNYGEKYNNKNIYNNGLSDKDSSVTGKEDTLKQKDVLKEKADTPVPKKRLPERAQKKKTKSELKELESDMIERFSQIALQYELSDTCYRNTVKAFKYYLAKYSEKTNKVHPILSDKTLERIFETLAMVNDAEYSHFENISEIAPDENGNSYLDDLIDEHFESTHEQGTDWHISHFASMEYLEKMAQHVVDW